MLQQIGNALKFKGRVFNMIMLYFMASSLFPGGVTLTPTNHKIKSYVKHIKLHTLYVLLNT